MTSSTGLILHYKIEKYVLIYFCTYILVATSLNLSSIRMSYGNFLLAQTLTCFCTALAANIAYLFIWFLALRIALRSF